MTKDEVIKKVLSLMTIDALKKSVEKLMIEKPNNDGLILFRATLNAKDDAQHLWFTAFAVLCTHKPNLSGKIIENAIAQSGNPPVLNMNKKELIDAIASGSKLTKADAGRLRNPEEDKSADGAIEVIVKVKK